MREHASDTIHTHYLGSSSVDKEAGPNPQPQFIIAREAPFLQCTVSGFVPVKVEETESQMGDGSGVSVHRAICGSSSNALGGGSIKQPVIQDEGEETSTLVSVGERTSLDFKVMQITFGSDKTYSDLDG